jgi:hypothetical protein
MLTCESRFINKTAVPLGRFNGRADIGGTDDNLSLYGIVSRTTCRHLNFGGFDDYIPFRFPKMGSEIN